MQPYNPYKRFIKNHVDNKKNAIDHPILLIFDIDGTIIKNETIELYSITNIINDTFDVGLLSLHLPHLLEANIQISFASFNTDFSEIIPSFVERRYCGTRLATVLMQNWVLKSFKNMLADHAIEIANEHVSNGFIQAWRPLDKNSFNALPGKNIHILRIFEAYKTKYGRYPLTKNVYFYDDVLDNIAHANTIGINTIHIDKNIGVQKHQLPKLK